MRRTRVSPVLFVQPVRSVSRAAIWVMVSGESSHRHSQTSYSVLVNSCFSFIGPSLLALHCHVKRIAQLHDNVKRFLEAHIQEPSAGVGRAEPAIALRPPLAAPREFCRPQAAKYILIVFPGTCALEKLFARSERRIVRLWRTTEAQSEAGRPLGRRAGHSASAE